MIGDKRERLLIQSCTEIADAEGHPVKTWRTLTTAWARAEYLSGQELEAMQKINAEIAVKFTVNYRPEVNEKMRVQWRGSTWNIHGVLPAEDKFDMRLAVSKVE